MVYFNIYEVESLIKLKYNSNIIKDYIMFLDLLQVLLFLSTLLKFQIQRIIIKYK